MAEVDPKLCIALDDINEAMDCENQDNMGGIIPSVIFGYHADVATWPDYPKRRNPLFLLNSSFARAMSFLIWVREIRYFASMMLMMWLSFG